MTKYQVWRRTSVAEGIPTFQLVGEYEANDPKSAVRAAVLKMPEEEQAKVSSTTFATCASSAWQELAPKVETAVTFA